MIKPTRLEGDVLMGADLDTLRVEHEGGELRRFINIYVNEEDIRFMDGKKTALKDGDAVSIVPAIAGGR